MTTREVKKNNGISESDLQATRTFLLWNPTSEPQLLDTSALIFRPWVDWWYSSCSSAEWAESEYKRETKLKQWGIKFDTSRMTSWFSNNWSKTLGSDYSTKMIGFIILYFRFHGREWQISSRKFSTIITLIRRSRLTFYKGVCPIEDHNVFLERKCAVSKIVKVSSTKSGKTKNSNHNDLQH